MGTPDLMFVIPTGRLCGVGAGAEASDQHVWRNGHPVRIGLDRAACRRVFEERSDAARMAREYVEVYRGFC